MSLFIETLQKRPASVGFELLKMSLQVAVTDGACRAGKREREKKERGKVTAAVACRAEQREREVKSSRSWSCFA